MKTIGLLSGKGGVGKTTSALNLAAALNSFGQDVIVLDGNLTTPNLALHLGIAQPETSIHHVLKGQKKIHEAIHTHNSGLKFIPGSLSLSDMQNLRLQRFKSIKNLSSDYLILDGAAGLGGETIKIIEHSDDLIIVTNPELPAITDALKTVKLTEELGKNVLGILVTRTKNDDLDISLRNIEAIIEKPVIGVIPEDDSLREALSLKDSVIHTHPASKSSRAYKRLASTISGISYSEPVKEDLISKVWKFIIGR
ncbi:P-loop NTPase [archaeon]|jgi:septum site-determining protein MinD|nr:P-loop NTPase [archaeon]MBT3731137.1 P-loop NTPase [archaeon]MBT4669708.1 P-loop NTPase [archaeon]MBT7052996.1 P-loop NTPase [archaeon]MBT7281248.1 P-loop NTPase [archaeon]